MLPDEAELDAHTDGESVGATPAAEAEGPAPDSSADAAHAGLDAAAPPETGEPAVAVEPSEPPAPPDKKNWYIVKVQSGREDTIKQAIERKVKRDSLEEFFGQIIVPVEKETVIVNGKRRVRTRKKYPGYIFANVEFNDQILYLFRDTSGVGDFVGGGPNRAPLPMPKHEVEKMLINHLPTEQAREQVGKIVIGFDKGDRVKVRDGTFAGMEGEVKEILEPRDAKEAPRVRVELTIFGRPVPVEVEVWQVESP